MPVKPITVAEVVELQKPPVPTQEELDKAFECINDRIAKKAHYLKPLDRLSFSYRAYNIFKNYMFNEIAKAYRKAGWIVETYDHPDDNGFTIHRPAMRSHLDELARSIERDQEKEKQRIASEKKQREGNFEGLKDLIELDDAREDSWKIDMKAREPLGDWD